MERQPENHSPNNANRRGVIARFFRLYDDWVTFIGGDELPKPDAPTIVEIKIPGLPEGQEATREDILAEVHRLAIKNGRVFIDPSGGVLAPTGALTQESRALIDSALTGLERTSDPAYWAELEEGARQLEESQGQSVA